MPYIKQEQRSKLAGVLQPLLNMEFSDGEMNYIITSFVDVQLCGRNYEHYERAVGLLECVKQEIYRRRVAIYEDEKCKENGEVFE